MLLYRLWGRNSSNYHREFFV